MEKVEGGSLMKLVLKTSFLLVMILLLAGFTQQASGQGTAPAASGPSAQISEMTFDFGELVEGKDYIHDFKIKNSGAATLEIKKVLPG